MDKVLCKHYVMQATIRKPFRLGRGSLGMHLKAQELQNNSQPTGQLSNRAGENYPPLTLTPTNTLEFLASRACPSSHNTISDLKIPHRWKRSLVSISPSHVK